MKNTNIEGLTHNQFIEMLRDQIAISAMEGLLVNPEPWEVPTLKEVQEEVAKLAYGYANAMLAERLKHLNKDAE